MNGKRKIVIFGATGKQGDAVANAMLKSPDWAVTAVTRNTESAAAQALRQAGALVEYADLQNQTSVFEAVRGAYGVFAVTQPWSAVDNKFNKEKEILQGKNIIWACREAGVNHVVFSSMFNFFNKPTGISFIDSKCILEEIIKTYTIRCTVLRCSLYMESLNIVRRQKNNIFKSNFADDLILPYVALQDVGNAVSVVFNNYDLYKFRTIDLIGDLVTGKEIVALLNRKYQPDSFLHRPAGRLRQRILQPEIYKLRRYLEQVNQTPDIPEMRQAYERSLACFPFLTNMEDFLNR